MKSKQIISLILSVFMAFADIPAAVLAAGEDTIIFSTTTENKYITLDDVSYEGGVVTLTGVNNEPSAEAVALVAKDFVSGKLVSIEQSLVGSRQSYSISFNPGSCCSLQLSFSGKETGVMKAAVTIISSDLQENINQLSEELEQVKGLMSECETMGIDAYYEKTYIKLIERSIEVMNREVGLNTDRAIIDTNLITAHKACAQIVDDLNEYIAGTKQPQAVPKITTEGINYSGKSLVGNVNSDGTSVTQPIFLNGYCSGFENRDEVDLLNGFGQNLASESLNFNNVIGEVGYPVGWSLNPGVKGYADADFTVTKEEKYYGESSLKIVNRSTADENKYGYLYQTFTINPNTTYRFGGRYLSNSNNDVEIFFGYGNSVATISQTSSRWKSFSTTYTTTADEAGMIVIGILVKDICEGLYLDDFYLFEGNSTVNLLDNPDFEKTFISNDGLDLGICEQSVYDFKDKLDKYNENNISVIMTPCLLIKLSGVRIPDGSPR